MFNVLLILIFVGGIVIAAIFAGVTFLQGVRSAQEIQITKQRLVETAARIQSQARYINGYIALPQGSTGSSPYGYNQVPTWISSYARSASGVPFEYCPYAISDVSGTSANITMPSSATYSIKYTNNASTISQNYVTGGSTAPAGAPSGTIGLLIAAAPQSNQPPNCSSISASADGTPVVTGGIVVPIQDNFLNKMKMATAPTDLRIYVAAAGTGDGTGRDTNNYATPTTAMNLISYAKPAQVTLYLTAATHTFSGAFAWGGRLHIEGASAGTTTARISTLVLDESSMISVRNATLMDVGAGGMQIYGELQLDSANLTSSNGIAIYGGRLISRGSNTITGNVTVDGGGFFADTDASALSIAGLGNRGFKIINGTYAMDGGSTSLATSTSGIVIGYVGAGGLVNAGGNMNVNSAASISLNGGFVVDPGGRLGTSNNSGNYYFYRLNGFGVYAHGGFELGGAGTFQTRSADVSGLSYGIILGSGGYFVESQHSGANLMVSDAFANRPNIAVYDNGGSRFIMNYNTSASVIQAKTDCWHGRSGTNLFSDTTNAGTSTGHVSYTAQSAGYRWLRLYNQSFSSCTIL